MIRKMRFTTLKYLEVIRITTNELFASPGNFLGRMFVHAFRITILGFVYSYVFTQTNTNSVNGMSLVEAVWSIGFIQIVYQCSRNTFRLLKDEILSGQIETKLNKPYSFVTFLFFESLGQTPIKFIGFITLTTVTLGIFFGFPTLKATEIIGIVLLFLLGVVVHTLIQELLALAAFWIENPEPIFWISTKLSWIVNGTFVPLAMLPLLLRKIADFFPLSAPFFIGRIFEMTSTGLILKYLVIQVFWIGILIGLISFFYKKGIKKVSLHGG